MSPGPAASSDPIASSTHREDRRRCPPPTPPRWKPGPTSSATAYDRVKAEIAKVIVGHDEIVHGVLTCLFVGGHALLEGRAGAGQDAADPDPGRRAVARLQPDPVHARPDAGRHHRHQHRHGDARRPARRSSSSAGRSSRRSSWPTRSTGPRPRPSRPCWRRCRSTRSPSAATIHTLKEPFFVMATQNPIEQEGTYPLPEAQLDRFLFKLVVGYSTREELTIDPRPDHPRRAARRPSKVIDGETLIVMQALVREVIVAPHVQDYAIRLALATHPEGPVRRRRSPTSTSAGGRSPRGVQTLVLAAKVRALLDGRYQRQLRGPPPRLPARPPAPRPAQLRGPGRGGRAPTTSCSRSSTPSPRRPRSGRPPRPAEPTPADRAGIDTMIAPCTTSTTRPPPRSPGPRRSPSR